jgi:EAL domain-containing protein (putative c-di-GMP-specific phosphodiesterase class I)
MLIRNADIAMYRAKQLGGNTYQYFTPEINARALNYLKLEASLRQALARKEFRLYYQPRIDIASGRITGVEALLRWQSPEHGLLGPGEFVPLLEESGLIIPVGEWVLATACRQAKAWEQARLPRVSIAVNVSARQFRRGNFAQTVTRTLREAGLSPGQLELEITESAMMLDTGAGIPAFGELKRLGVALSIDDFGTGYCSLNYLKRFDVDSLKIDRCFIKDITLDPKNDTITTAIIAMAHALGCKAIAEGVETRAQLDFLTGHGCDEYQGYLFSKPLDADELACLWRSRSAVVAPLRNRRTTR